MKLTATLSYKSLSQLLKDVNAYKTNFERKVGEFLEELASRAAQQAEYEFDGQVVGSYEKVDDNRYSIYANGEEIGFLEFGTGVYADSSHPYASGVPFRVAPGSWSNEHEGTWERWLAKGNDPGEYPYNMLPLRGMLRTYNWMRDHAPEIAKEVFSR